MAPELPEILEINVIVDPSVSIAGILKFALQHLVERDDFRPDKWHLIGELKNAESEGEADRPGNPTLDNLESLGEEAFAEGFWIKGKTAGLVVHNLATTDDKNPAFTYGQAAGWRRTGNAAEFEAA